MCPLEYLNLEYTDFVGDIPHNLGNLTNLQILDLSLNSGLVAKNLEWLSRLAFLRGLNLDLVHIETENWLQQIIKPPSLEKLNLRACVLPDPIISTAHLSSNVSYRLLSSLNLDGNELSSSTFQWLFNLRNNELCGPPLAECPKDRDTQSPFTHPDRINNLDEDDKILSFGVYASVASGYILGFWGLIFTLILEQSFRDAYFQLLTKVADWIFVSAILSLRRLKMLSR
ncbi:hypothetical protein K7X08_026525 [Anisodus acutangulus]|uniref:Uncharacterized protein n=1 Tax=Anisodus acutangulus TaxID=402998 RepID=A0A9Q1LQK8_9SOLA|nr:hypothetical protein K7X08_026525 [Anisodus acutangulus]